MEERVWGNIFHKDGQGRRLWRGDCLTKSSLLQEECSGVQEPKWMPKEVTKNWIWHENWMRWKISRTRRYYLPPPKGSKDWACNPPHQREWVVHAQEAPSHRGPPFQEHINSYASLPAAPHNAGGFLTQDINFQLLEVPNLHAGLKGFVRFG